MSCMWLASLRVAIGAMYLCLKILLIKLIFLSIVLVKCEYTRTLRQGRVQGTLNRQHNYWTYYGIPYASVVERYEVPGDPPIWNGTLKTDRSTIICKQFDPATNSVVGVEDCLTLNIYTPAVITKPLPVIVFIFGGGLYKGSNTDDRYNARYLVNKGVVVVTINYRVGAFGFLCLKTKGASGNVGIKDQIAALRWVKNNIEVFGGDPNSITLHGESVGGSSISLFILTQAAKGLFHRAIMDSGNAIRPLFFDGDPISTAAKVASRLGYKTADPEELLVIFKNATADEIVTATHENSTNNVYERFVFAMCVEDDNKNAVLKETPIDLLNSVNGISDISIIMGYDNKEGIMWASDYNPEGLRALDSDFTSVIPKSITFGKEEYKSLFIDEVRELYFNNSSTTINGLIDYFSDALVHYPSILVMEAFLTNPRISLYNYFFKYDSARNKYKLSSSLRMVPGASHCDELYYLYDPVEYRYEEPTPEDFRMINVMTSLWTSFARTGTPSTESACEDFAWMRSDDTLTFLSIDSAFDNTGIPNQKRIDFWRRVQEKYGLRYL